MRKNCFKKAVAEELLRKSGRGKPVVRGYMRRAAAKKQLRKDGLRRAVAESRLRRALEKRHWERAVSEEKGGKRSFGED